MHPRRVSTEIGRSDAIFGIRNQKNRTNIDILLRMMLTFIYVRNKREKERNLFKMKTNINIYFKAYIYTHLNELL